MVLGRHCGACSSVEWNPEVAAYFTSCFGAARLAAMSSALARPSLTLTLRVNTLRSRPQDVVTRLQQELWKQEQRRQQRRIARAEKHMTVDAAGAAPKVIATERVRNTQSPPSASHPSLAQPPQHPRPQPVMLHSRVPAAVVLYGTGPSDVSYDPGLAEVVVSRFAGEAALKGANVYAPGVLAASAGIAAGDLVNVSAALERPVGHSGTGVTGCWDGLEAATHGSMSTSFARLSVGISRGATVEADGSVPLAWAQQPKHQQHRRRGRKRSPQYQLQVQRQTHQDQGREGDGMAGDRVAGGGALPNPGCDAISASGGSASIEGSSSGVESCDADSVSRTGTSCNSSRDAITSGSGSSSGTSDGGESTLIENRSHDGRHSSCSNRSDRVFLGIARAAVGRRAMFRAQEGLALEMEHRLYDVPPCNGLLRGEVMLQALPSIIAAQALRPRLASRVLDMCAAPGGKTTLLAAIMHDRGHIVALDRTAAKVGEIMSLARDLGVTCVEAYQADATEAVAAAAAEPPTTISFAADPRVACLEGTCSGVAETSSAAPALQQSAPAAATASRAAPSAPAPPPPFPAAAAAAVPAAASSVGTLLGPPPYPRGTFDYVLLDPPCSALGLRPRLLHSWSLQQLRAMAAYQRSLLYTAVQLLAPGGEMVYCTCTINPDENEANVAWALDRFEACAPASVSYSRAATHNVGIWAACAYRAYFRTRFSGSLELLPAEPLLGVPGLTGADPLTGARWLHEGEAAMVQRFDPGMLLPGRRMAPPFPLLLLHQDWEQRNEAGKQQQKEKEEEQDKEEEQQEEEKKQAAGAADELRLLRPDSTEAVADDVMGFFIARFRKVP